MTTGKWIPHKKKVLRDQYSFQVDDSDNLPCGILTLNERHTCCYGIITAQ